ncbi:MAG: hypothetical protein A3G38_00820 [Omnitrophica WOR_2 bacterium RIFCSPLOWO2_12_FULL_51_8]|nr:MAG: hypothetical protein A3G38_00820 [Omnitrophica WOR_2 bacterium RIFCSPLOWO2_12_FULL_51_8]
MPTFTYKARDAVGRLTRGFIDAEDQLKAAFNIEKLGLSPIDISTPGRPYHPKNLMMVFSFKKVSRQEALVFTRQLSTLISTGAPLIQSLNNVREQAQNIRFKQVIAGLIASLEGGLSFSAALSQYPHIFPKLYVSLVKVGETAGLLDKVLARLADLSTQEIDMQSRLRSALVYPAVLAGIAFLIVNFVLVGILPKFVSIFEASSAKLPLPTKVLLSLSYILNRFWWLLILAVIFGLSSLRNYHRSPAGRLKIDALLLRLPFAGPLLLKIMVARFSRSTAALVMSGVPVLEALGVWRLRLPMSSWSGSSRIRASPFLRGKA